jgi:hypothetical protein
MSLITLYSPSVAIDGTSEVDGDPEHVGEGTVE